MLIEPTNLAVGRGTKSGIQATSPAQTQQFAYIIVPEDREIVEGSKIEWLKLKKAQSQTSQTGFDSCSSIYKLYDLDKSESQSTFL